MADYGCAAVVWGPLKTRLGSGRLAASPGPDVPGRCGMSSLEVRQLEYFLAVHDHGGVTRAAKALHLSQPSLSQAIRSLERQLRTELFLRVGRGLVLAPAGQALLEPARQVLRSM